MGICTETLKIGVSSKMREANKYVKNDQFESRLGDHREAVQGPHSRLIFRLARWPSNWLFGGPRTVTQKAPFCRKKRFFYFLWSLNWLSGKGSSGPAGGCPALYIYAVELLSGPSLGFLKVIIWSKFVFYKTPIVKKHYKIGVSALFFEQKIAR